MIFDPIYLLFVFPALLLSIWASIRVKSSFKKFSRVPTARGLTGAEAAALLLRQAGVPEVT
ncbi:MAG TPA: zinc metallopeptidase, partial [Acidobacteriota bacterium]|nr:zinc metallopeptidase [Acidobacteriota bacterium]